MSESGKDGLLQELAMPTMPRAAERATEACWIPRYSPPRKYPAAWADCTDSDDRERTQCAGHEAAGSKEGRKSSADQDIESALHQAQIDSAMATLGKSKRRTRSGSSGSSSGSPPRNKDTHSRSRAPGANIARDSGPGARVDVASTKRPDRGHPAGGIAGGADEPEPDVADPTLAQAQQPLRASAAGARKTSRHTTTEQP